MDGAAPAGMDTETVAGLPESYPGRILLLLARPITRWALGGTERLEESGPGALVPVLTSGRSRSGARRGFPVAT